MSKINSKLLQDAIIDARAVRATALANARESLTEAFNQRFSAVFADKLREDSSMEDNVDATPVAESTEKEKVGATKPSKSDGTKAWAGDNKGPGPTDKNITPNTIPAEKSGGDGTKTWSKDNTAGYDARSTKDLTPTLKEASEDGNTNEAVEETVTNEDLDEIIRELEAEAGATPDSEPPAVGDAAPPIDDPAAAGPETPEEDAQEIKAGDTVTITGTVAKAAPEAETPPVAPDTGAEAPAGELPTGPEDTNAPPMEEDIDLNELLASLNEEAKEKEDAGEKEEKEDEKEEKNEVDETLQAQLNEAISQRDEAYKTVEYLRSQINEINLLNAKLLYTNKLFKEFGMNCDQKTTVVEAFDLTKNVREVKMTYANWCESLNFGGNLQRRPQAVKANVPLVTEGKASKPVASTKPSVITENVNTMAERFKKLAGIPTTKK